MKRKALFSVIIPLYNKADYILKTLSSITYQSFEDYEVVIVDDGSTDDSVEKICLHFQDEKMLLKHFTHSSQQIQTLTIL